MVKDLYYWFNKKRYSFLCWLAKEQIEDAKTDTEIETWRNCQKEIEESYKKGYDDGRRSVE